jgi:hypothetical protein
MKRIALVLTLSFLVSNGITAEAAVKTGASCSKAGSTSVVSGKKYTCIKSGKKLVWNKGVAVKVLKPSTPTTSPSNEVVPVAPTVQPIENIENSICTKLGENKSNSLGTYECRRVVENKLRFIKVLSNYIAISNPISPEPLSTCQLPDARGAKKEWTSIGYPATPTQAFRNSGVEKIVVVGVDFSDAPGKGKPSELFKNDIDLATQWVNWYSNSKLKFEFVTIDEWIRAPKTSDNYNVGDHAEQLGSLTLADMKTDFVLSIENYVDLSNTTAIWMYFPSDITKLVGKFAQRGSPVFTKKYGTVIADIYGIGKTSYDSKVQNWTFNIHEMLHAQGIMGHSPRAPWVFSVAMTDAGPSRGLDPWSQLILGWTNPEQNYCVKVENLKSTNLTLVPNEREQQGLNSAMIKLSETKMLIVESHRSDKWSPGLEKGFYGVMVSLLDMTATPSWGGEEGFSRYLRVDNANHGLHQPIGIKIPGFPEYQGNYGLINGYGVANDQIYWELNYMMYQGESITYEGIKISLISTGDNDTIEISKIA